MRQISLYQLVVILSCMLLCQSCVTVFSELQSARTVGKDRVEVMPSYSSVNVGNDGESDPVQNHLGLQMAYGVTDKLDIRLRYEFIWAKDGGTFDDGVSLFGIGPKYSFVKNKLAVALPMGKAFGEDYKETWQIHPTVLLTIPAITDKLDVTFSPKYLIAFCENCENLLALNLGFAISSDLNDWAIRPEYGLLFDPGDSGYAAHFSIGISKFFGTRSED